jgi:hypothetical protein
MSLDFPSSRSPWLRRAQRGLIHVCSWLPFLVPAVYVGVVFWFQPPDRLGELAVDPRLGRLIYDDYDPAARALRGLNDSLGRRAGRLDEPRWLTESEFCQQLDAPAEPDAFDRPYFLEYPHTALWMFRLGYDLGNRVAPDLVPPAVRDGDFHNLVGHPPHNEAEQQLWRHLRRAIQLYAVFGACCLVGLVAVLRHGYQPGELYTFSLLLLILPATLYFAVNRYDVVPALLTALSLACLGRRHLVASAAFLAAATMIKVYPVLLAPLVMRYLSAERRPALVWTAAYGATAALLLALPLLLYGWQTTLAPYRFQLSRQPEGWTLYGYVLPWFLAQGTIGSAFRNGVVLLAVVALCWHRPADLTGLLRRGAVVLLLFVSLQVFYSPQWIIWFSPFLVPLAARSRPILWLTIALDLVTYNSFPVVYDLPSGPGEELLRAELIYARAVICTGLVWMLLRAEFGRSQPPPV